MADAVEPGDRLLAGAVRQGRVRRAGTHQLDGAMRRGAAKHNDVEQRVAAKPVGAVHRDASRFADRHQPRDDRVGIAFGRPDHLAAVICRDAAHVVMHGRQYRDRLARDIDAGEDLRGFRDAGQALVQHVRVEMLEM